MFPSSKKCFSTILGNFWKFEFLTENSTGRDLTKIVKIQYYLQLCEKNIFWQNYLFLSSKEVFLHNLRQFLEIWIFDGNSTGANLTKILKIITISNCVKKIFFGKIICSFNQKKCFSTILGDFWKFEFLTEIQQARTLQK